MASDSTSEVLKRQTENPEKIDGYSWTVRDPQHEKNCSKQIGTSLKKRLVIWYDVINNSISEHNE